MWLRRWVDQLLQAVARWLAGMGRFFERQAERIDQRSREDEEDAETARRPGEPPAHWWAYIHRHGAPLQWIEYEAERSWRGPRAGGRAPEDLFPPPPASPPPGVSVRPEPAVDLSAPGVRDRHPGQPPSSRFDEERVGPGTADGAGEPGPGTPTTPSIGRRAEVTREAPRGRTASPPRFHPRPVAEPSRGESPPAAGGSLAPPAGSDLRPSVRRDARRPVADQPRPALRFHGPEDSRERWEEREERAVRVEDRPSPPQLPPGELTLAGEEPPSWPSPPLVPSPAPPAVPMPEEPAPASPGRVSLPAPSRDTSQPGPGERGSHTWPRPVLSAPLSPASLGVPARPEGHRGDETVDRWPQLPDASSLSAAEGDDWEAQLRAWRHLQRLELEQKGNLWNELPF
jgi:hypothetical protein